MTEEEFLVRSRAVVDKFVRNYKNNSMDERDNYLYSLLKEIIIIEPSSISTDIIFSQLKESYFHTDLSTSLFITKLYSRKVDTIQEYMDIYLEQIVENTILIPDVKNKVSSMRTFISGEFPDLVPIYDQKANEYGNGYRA